MGEDGRLQEPTRDDTSEPEAKRSDVAGHDTADRDARGRDVADDRDAADHGAEDRDGRGRNAEGRQAKNREPKSSISRRTFVIGVGSTVALLGLGSTKYLGTESLVRPPGGQDQTSLVGTCVHCGRCSEACLYHLIKSAKIENGIMNVRTPYLKFSDNYGGEVDALKYCDFCVESNDGMPRCVEVCPSSALSLEADFDPETMVLGVAELNKDICIAYRGDYCAYCYEACRKVRGDDESAISYEPGSGGDGAPLPVVDPDVCNGCGACESVCVSTQATSAVDIHTRAITVKPLDV
jgi:ferredoxin-type protein NapG